MRKERLLRGKLGIVLASAMLAAACGGSDEELLGTETEEGLEDGKADWASVRPKRMARKLHHQRFDPCLGG
jgi:hypothetical protein